jgi:hypothetical protein
MGAAIALIIVAALAGAQGEPEIREGPDLVVLVHHPYPDTADPLGFPYDGAGFNGTGYYQQKYAIFDKENDGFAYPHLVVDGILPVEGLPDPQRPYQATYDAYQGVLKQRLQEEAAAALEVRTQVAADQVLVAAQVLPSGPMPGEHLEAWMALVEDNVRYEPPPAVSNGVVNHRFTVRAITNLGTIDLSQGTPAQLTAAFRMQPAWEREQLHIAFWLQQGASYGTRFDANEVAQATIHPVQDNVVTRQTVKAVLMEGLSATWCLTCLYGDTVLEDLAQQHGYAVAAKPESTGYWRPPTHWGIAILALVGAAALALPRIRRDHEDKP